MYFINFTSTSFTRHVYYENRLRDRYELLRGCLCIHIIHSHAFLCSCVRAVARSCFSRFLVFVPVISVRLGSRVPDVIPRMNPFYSIRCYSIHSFRSILVAQGIRLGGKTQQDSAGKIRDASHQVVGRPLPPFAVGPSRDTVRHDPGSGVGNNIVAQFVLKVAALLDAVDRVDTQPAAPGPDKGEPLDAARAAYLAKEPLQRHQDRRHQPAGHRQDCRRPSAHDQAILGRRIGLVEETLTPAVGASVPDPGGFGCVDKCKEIARI